MAPKRRPWFRFYVEAIWDRKLRRLSPAHRWLWVVVLAVARDSALPGFLILSVESGAMTEQDWADAAAMPIKAVKKGLACLQELGLIALDPDLGALYVVNWNDRQFESDDVTERTRKHRGRNDDPPPSGTRMERSINGDTEGLGTPPENREQKTDTETDISPLPPHSGGTEDRQPQHLTPRQKGTNPRAVTERLKAERRSVVENCPTCEGRTFILDAADNAVDCPDCTPKLRVVQ